MFDFLDDFIDEIIDGIFGTADSAGTGGSGGDVHFGSSTGPVCPACAGTGRSLYPSSGTTGVCYTCGGSGH